MKSIEKKFFEVMQSQVESDESSLDNLVELVNKRLWIFRFFPFVKQVAVCNNLSFGLASKKSDIDLFFILDSKRFFTARFLITFLLYLFGYRRHHKYISKRFCLSFFISDQNLNLENLRISDSDYYFYFWTKHLIFLKDNKDFIENFYVSNNTWFNLDCLEFTDSQKKFRSRFNFFKSNFVALVLEKFLMLSIFDYFEDLLKKYQLNRACKKNSNLGNPKGVVIKDGILKFHVLDSREAINSNIKF